MNLILKWYFHISDAISGDRDTIESSARGAPLDEEITLSLNDNFKAEDQIIIESINYNRDKTPEESFQVFVDSVNEKTSPEAIQDLIPENQEQQSQPG